MTRPYIYSTLADTDLREILRYTRRKWGAEQVRTYARQIDDAAAALATGHATFKNWDALLPGLRIKQVGSHYIAAVHRPGRPALILAILHERMDLMARLKGRLAAL